MRIAFKPTFIRQLNDLEHALQEETLEKIELFKNQDNHKKLHVHKLHGRLKERWSFSVNYRYRIIFEWLSEDVVALLAIGDHSVYDA